MPNDAELPREKLSRNNYRRSPRPGVRVAGFRGFAFFYKVLEKRNLDHEKIVTLAESVLIALFLILNGHGAHFLHGRAVRSRAASALARPDPLLFVWRRRRLFSMGGNHLNHATRKNVNLVYFSSTLRLWPDQKADLATSPRPQARPTRPARSHAGQIR